MVAKIRLEAEDATKDAFDSARKGAEGVEKSLDNASAAMKKHADAAEDVFHSLEELKDNLNETDAKLILIKTGFKENEIAAMGLEEQLANARHELDVFADNASQAGSAAGKMHGDLSQADVTLMQMRSTMRGMSGDLDRLEAEERKAADGADRAARSFDRLGKEAGGVRGPMGQMGSAIGDVYGVGGKFLGWLAAVWAFKETFAKLAQGAVYLAEKGNPAFDELQQKGQKLVESLVKLAELKSVQDMINGIASGVGELAEFIDRNAESIDYLIKRTRDLMIVEAEFREMIGKAPDGYANMVRLGVRMLNESEKAYKEQFEKEKIRVQQRRQNAEIDKAMHTLEMERTATKEAATAKQITDAKELSRLQEEEIARVRKLAKEGKATEEEVQSAQRRWKMYEQQKADLETKAAEEKKKNTEETQKKEAEAKKTIAEKSAEMAKAENDKKLADFEEYVNKLLQTVDSINKQQGGPEVDIETMGGGVASRERAEKFMMQKDVEAAQDEAKKKWEGHGHRNDKGEFIDKAATEKYQQLKEAAKSDLDKEFADRGPRNADGTFEDKATQREYQRELSKRNSQIARENFKDQRFTASGEVLDTFRSSAYAEDMNRAKKNALAESRKQIRSGSRDEQLDQMQMDFANSFIEQEGANSNLSKANVRALKQAVEASVKNKMETEKLAMDVEQLQRFLAENMNARQQAQRKSY